MDSVDFAALYGDYVLPLGISILKGFVVLIIGWWVIGLIAKALSKILDKTKFDRTLKGVVKSAIGILLKVALLLAVLGTIGIKTTSFVAILGGLSIAAGLALQGSLANLGGSILILFFRPFIVDDYIKAQGEEGFVTEISLFTTTLETPDKVTVFLPNGALAGGNITNVTRNGIIRLHLACGIGYGEDIKAARSVLLEVMHHHPKVLSSPAPEVAVTNLGDSSVDLTLRPWCKPSDAPAVTVEIIEAAKIALDKANIDIPYPQQVVHHINAK